MVISTDTEKTANKEPTCLHNKSPRKEQCVFEGTMQFPLLHTTGLDSQVSAKRQC